MAPDSAPQFVMTGRQGLVLSALVERNQKIGALYEDALRAVQEGRTSNRFYPAGHAIRLFMHDMPNLFDLPTLGSLPQLTTKIRDLDPVWKTACKSRCRVDGGWKGEIDCVLAKLLSTLEGFFTWREDQIPKKQQIAEKVFRQADPGPATLPSDLLELRAKRWLKLFGYFSSVAHLGSTSLEEFQERLTEVEDIVLSCLYREPSANFAAIDAILAEAEAMLKPELIDRALREIENGYAEYSYFFENLKSPAWLQPLADRGRFRLPPPPIRDGQYISSPVWPELLYLVRMAHLTEAQETVLKIALAIPDSENCWVHDHIADVALALRPTQAAKLVPQICASIPFPIKLPLPEKIGHLIVHLAEGGQGMTAATLAGAALALTPDPRMEEREGDDWLFFPKPRPQFPDWQYARIIEKAVPALAKSSGFKAVQLFCGLLNSAIELLQKRPEVDEEDGLYMSQPAIEQGKNSDNIPSLLLCAVRDAAELVIAEDPTRFPAALALLKEQKWISYRRLELHISRIFMEQGQAEAERVFQDPEIINSARLRHEAILLLKAAFPALAEDTKRRILLWMDAGPSEESVRISLECFGSEVTEETIRDWMNRRRRDYFSILEGQLPEPYRLTYEELRTDFGAPNPLERISSMSFGAIGVHSPKSVEELAQMSVAEVLTFLRWWVPGHNSFRPTADGLGVALSKVVSQRPGEFALVAENFKGLDPTYVRRYFAGMTAALKQGVAWDWRPVLELAAWVVSQQREIEGRKGGSMDVEPDWGWTRDSIVDLLATGFEGGPDRLSYDHRTLVWDVLCPLTQDPNPSTERELGENFDPSFLAINSTRGRALYAVVDYASWVRRCTDAERKAAGDLPLTFDGMPEVRETLDAHLDVEREPTLTARSIYGQLLWSLACLDWEWLRSNVERILPSGQDDTPRFNAAWGSFVGFNPPNTILLPVLMCSYQRAVAQIAHGFTMKHGPFSPENRLAEHLMVYIGDGKLQFGAEDGLLDDFYSLAPDELRGHASWFVGTTISAETDGVTDELIVRFRELFDRRLKAAAQAASPILFTKELANFGYWFSSEAFDERWSIETLLATLKLTKHTRAEMEVVKLLAERCPRYPVECVACLGLMVEGDRERWLLLGVGDDAQRVLKLALESNQPEAVLSARRLIESLIARGHFEFRKLLG